ncbi:MAK10-like protein [Tanacetum coccineum]
MASLMDPQRFKQSAKWPRPTTVDGDWCPAPILTLPSGFRRGFQIYKLCIEERTGLGRRLELQKDYDTIHPEPSGQGYYGCRATLIKEAQRDDVRLWAIGEQMLKTALREKVMTEAHSSSFTIHPGSTKMYRDLKQYFWWNGMKQDVATFVSKCMTCQQVKIEHQRDSGLLQPLEIPMWKWDEISMDFVTGLPTTAWGEETRYSKVGRDFSTGIVRLHGTSGYLLCTTRSEGLRSHFLERITEEAWETRLSSLQTFHPQPAWSTSERTIQTLEDMLKALCFGIDSNTADMSLSEEPESILDRHRESHENKVIPFVKIRWKNHQSVRLPGETKSLCELVSSFLCLVLGRGFLATANAVIDCKIGKIAVGEEITRSVFGVKGVDLGEEEAPYWTTLGKRESYKPRPSSDGIGARTLYYARKDFLDCHFPGEWEISRDAELNPFKDTLVFRRMVEFLGAIPINLKSNMWESDDLIKKPINWDKPPKNRDGAWHAKIRIIDPDGEEFTKTLKSIPATKKLFERENPIEIIDLDHFYDT